MAKGKSIEGRRLTIVCSEHTHYSEEKKAPRLATARHGVDNGTLCVEGLRVVEVAKPSTFTLPLLVWCGVVVRVSRTHAAGPEGGCGAWLLGLGAARSILSLFPSIVRVDRWID